MDLKAERVTRSGCKWGCSAWAWTLWEVELPLKDADRTKPLEVAVRAIDGAYNTQPEVRD